MKWTVARDGIVVTSSSPPINLQPHFGIIEDDSDFYSPEQLFSSPEIFQPISAFSITKPNNAFWLSTRLHCADATDVAISFQHLSYADLYIMPDTPNAVYTHQRAGAFRPVEELQPGDSRFHFQFRATAGVTYRIIIRSHHTKQYKPIFHFQLEPQYSFAETRKQQELIDHWFQGAGLLLLLYALVNWFTTLYRPYLWLALFISGLLLYNLSLSRYMIDWLFPHHPIRGWRLTIHFLHMGIAGLYLLILDFWKIKQKNESLFRLGQAFLIGIVFLSILSFYINYFTANFRVMSLINSSFIVVQIAYLLRLLLLWNSFDKQERFLGYGVILYLVVGLFVSTGLFVAGEAVYSLFSILSNSLLVTVSLLFCVGINGKIRQNEKDKNRYLAQLNQLQQEQNQWLEAHVAQRTQELSLRNKHIELLMNELNHRVKNNLQLLYSLNILQISRSKEVHAVSILKDNVSRIKAMMLVNERLHPGNNVDKKTIVPTSLITDIVEHSRQIFVLKQPVAISLQIDDRMSLDVNVGLGLGLIVTELLTNSYKHAFSAQPSPAIFIKTLLEDAYWTMHYHDNGEGVPEKSAQGFGFTLIADLTRQLKGEYKMYRDHGTHYFFTFPKPA